MKVELIIPIETLKGVLRKDGFYFRMYKDKQIVQKCPNRSGHVKTPAEVANQQRFAATWGQRYAHRHTMPGNEHTEDPHTMRGNEHTRQDDIRRNKRNN